jgi:tetratricopeptide (TPR) repeat protein
MSFDMDLLEVGEGRLYFDDPSEPQIDILLAEAAAHYGEAVAESFLLRAYFMAPKQLSVLVGLYRYYFYQHRLDDALRVAERAMEAAAERLHIDTGWSRLSLGALDESVLCSMGLMRFYLLALKASAVVLLRLDKIEEASHRLAKIVELDLHDRLGAAALLEIAKARASNNDADVDDMDTVTPGATETLNETCKPALIH